jgi:hypothetical protein
MSVHSAKGHAVVLVNSTYIFGVFYPSNSLPREKASKRHLVDSVGSYILVGISHASTGVICWSSEYSIVHEFCCGKKSFIKFE